MTCSRCQNGQMTYTGAEIAPGLYEHRCTNPACGYVEHLREKHTGAPADATAVAPPAPDNAALVEAIGKLTAAIERLARVFNRGGGLGQ